MRFRKLRLEIRQIPLGLLDLRAILIIFQANYYLALMNQIALLHADPGNSPDYLGGHFDLVMRDDVAGRVQDDALRCRRTAGGLNTHHADLDRRVHFACKRNARSPKTTSRRDAAHDPSRGPFATARPTAFLDRSICRLFRSASMIYFLLLASKFPATR